MSVTESSIEVPETLETSQLRAHHYQVLARLLRQSAEPELLQALSEVGGEDSPDDDLAVAWQLLAQAAGRYREADLEQEFFALFIGLGRGELVPFGSWYLTGYLMEKPLAQLRHDLQRLGLERAPGEQESEDHIANLCDAMALLLSEPGQAAEAEAFFEQHLAPWAERLFGDLQQAKSAHFYAAVGYLGSAFFRFEKNYYAMPV